MSSLCIQDIDEPPATDPTEARPFRSVISGLQKSYPKDKMEEISTSFCFICLLHLANEQGLKLESVHNKDEGEREVMASNQVGNIWDLKVRAAFLPAFSSRANLSLSSRCIEIRMPLSLHNIFRMTFDYLI
jgi:hypothetical protein